MKKKYYWFLWQLLKNGNIFPCDEAVCAQHPFEEIKAMNDGLNGEGKYVLNDWKPITQKEYNLYIQIRTGLKK